MKFKKQKGVFAPPVIIVVVVIIAAILGFFLLQRQTKGEKLPIPPSQLMPEVSAAEAWATICNLKKEGLFTEACQSKFEVIGKEDGEKIVELFTLLKKIQDDKSLSDYDRLLLGQIVFAALPNKDSPQTSQSRSSLLGVAYAQEPKNNLGMSEEEFKTQMASDLQAVVDSLPKENNAWVITAMVSKYSWIDGKRRPTYSHQYSESFDPFPNPNVKWQDRTYRVQAKVGSEMSGQTVNVGGSSYKGTSEMIAYDFTIVSWQSPKYETADGPVEEQFLVSKKNFTENLYGDEHYLDSLLNSVKMPSTIRPTESSDKEQASNDSKEITSCKELEEAFAKCPYMGGSQWPSGSAMPDPMEFWCFTEPGSITQRGRYSHFEIVRNRTRPPDYFIKLSEYNRCNKEYE